VVIEGSDGTSVTVVVEATRPTIVSTGAEPAFVETDGVISIEADSFARSVPGAGVEWRVIPDLGRTGSAIAAFPMAAPMSDSPGERAFVEYRVHVLTPGEVTVRVHASPTLGIYGEGGLRYAVGFGDEEPTTVRLGDERPQGAWNEMVANNTSVGTSTHTVDEPGVHTLRVYRVDPAVVIQKIVVDLGGLGDTYLGPPQSPRTTATEIRMPTRSTQARADESAADTGTHAVFDWFDYAGNDPVYDRHPAGPDDYRNPILAGFYPDPSITRVGDDFYLTNSTFAYFPGLPVFHSRDLVNWTKIGHALDRESQITFDNIGLSRGIFAPAIEHHDGLFYIVTTAVDSGGNFVLTAKDPAGPWSDPVYLPEVRGIDPSLFFDDDGSAWIINNDAPIGTPRYDGHRALWMQRFDPETLTTFGERTMVVDGGADPSTNPIWIEGPHIFKHLGSYYLICAEGGTSVWHSQVVFKADSPTGPWEPWEGNPILTQRHLDADRPDPITSAGHADFVKLDNGEWWATFLAVRPYEGNYYNTGRETFMMKVEWKDGWPVMTEGQDLIPYSAKRPGLPASAEPPVPTSGNFRVRDEFDSAELPLHWLSLRRGHADWATVDPDAGTLTLRARPVALADRGNPSYLGRRLQHMHAEAMTRMRYTPSREGDRAGLVAMQSDEFNYFLGLVRADGETWLRVEQRTGEDSPRHGRVLAERPITLEPGTPVDLRVDIRADTIGFAYRVGRGDWTALLEGADAKVLSTQRAGGFVGATIGPYAFRAGQ
jgi:xylan 1,4-beta-xylosidase